MDAKFFVEAIKDVLSDSKILPQASPNFRAGAAHLAAMILLRMAVLYPTDTLTLDLERAIKEFFPLGNQTPMRGRT